LGKTNTGSNHGKAQFTETQVSEIIDRLLAGESRQTLAKEYKVSLNTIKMIDYKRTWKHVWEQKTSTTNGSENSDSVGNN